MSDKVILSWKSFCKALVFTCCIISVLTKVISHSKHLKKSPSVIKALRNITAQKKKFPITDFFSKCNEIRRNLRIWSHLLEKSLMENFIFLYSVYCGEFYKVNRKKRIVMTELCFQLNETFQNLSRFGRKAPLCF